MYKTHQVRTTFKSWDVEKVYAVVARSTFRSQNVQSTPASDHFWTFRARFALSKVSKTWGFCSVSKNDCRCGTFEEDLQRCIFRGRCSARDIFIGAVRRWGRWFPERGCILEHQICRFAKMILRDRCSTSYDLASLFRGRRSTFDRWTGKIAKRIGTRLSALHSTFHFWRKSRRIALFLMLSSSKIEEVSQNCFVLDVVQFKNWRSLAELLRFSRERLRRVLRKKAAVVIHLHTLTSADLHLHTFTSADLHLHTFTSADLHLHTFTSAGLHLHTFTSADLHLHTLTSADLHLHTLTSADLHLHTFTSADLLPRTFTSADLLSLYLSLKAGAVPPERHETQPFRTTWTLDFQNLGKLAILKRIPRNPFARNGRSDVKNLR